MSIGQEVYTKRKGKNKYTRLNSENFDPARDEVKYKDLNKVDEGLWEDHNLILSDRNSAMKKHHSNAPITNPELESLQSNYHYFSNAQESNRRDMFKFNIK